MLLRDGIWIYESILTWMDESKYIWFNFQIFSVKTMPSGLLLFLYDKKSLISAEVSDLTGDNFFPALVFMVGKSEFCGL